MSWGWSFQPYVSAAEKRRRAEKAAKELARKKKRELRPVRIEGRSIAKSFWGKSWCQALEKYSDYENRLPRGRSYARSGSVVDLQIEAGVITAVVSGSSLYDVKIKIESLAKDAWIALKKESSGQVGSLIDLLQGRLAGPVMSLVTRDEGGLFPKIEQMGFQCSCPDWATMCKHAAAVLYGVGARLDLEPELLFKLRGANHLELVTAAAESLAHGVKDAAATIAADQLADVFGIEIDLGDAAPASPIASKPARPRGKAKPGRKAKVKAAAKKRSQPAGKKTKKKTPTVTKSAGKPGARKKIVPKAGRKSAAKRPAKESLKDKKTKRR